MGINKVQYGNTTLIDLTSDTVTADKLLQGYTAHDRTGAVITGTATGGGGSVTQDQDGFIVLPPDGGGSGGGSSVELIQKWTYDKLIVEDEEITLPAWSTSSQTLKATEELSSITNLNLDNYNYFCVVRGIAYPIYTSNDDYKGKTEYSLLANCSQLTYLPANEISSKSGVHISSNSINNVNSSQVYCIYWSSNSAVDRTTTMYGGGISPGTPVYSTSTGNWGIKTPTLTMRGNATYYSETAYNNTDDIRFQYVVEVYRENKQGSASISLMSQIDHIIDCLNNNNWTLT